MDFVARIPRFRACCIYVPIRTATIIITWISVISSCIYMAVAGYMLWFTSNKRPEPKDLHRIPYRETPDGYYYLMFCLGVVSFLVGSLGIIGVTQNKHYCLRIFLIWKLIHISVAIIVALVLANSLILLYLAFLGYLWLVVLSYYKGMYEGNVGFDPTPT